jgi:hypothetical protein
MADLCNLRAPLALGLDRLVALPLQRGDAI